MKLGILQKLLIGILVPLIVVLSIIGMLLGFNVSRTVEDLVRKDLTAETQSAGNQVQDFFGHYYGTAEMLTQSGTVLTVLNERDKTSITQSEGYRPLLLELQRARDYYQGEILNTFFYDMETGELLMSDTTMLTSSDLDVTTREWYTLPVERQTTSITSAYLDQVTGKQVVSIVSPVIINGRMAGIIGVDLDIQGLRQILSQITIGESGYITLYDHTDIILYHPSAEASGISVAEAAYSKNMETALLQNQDVEGISYTRSGNRHYGSTMYLPGLDYQILGVLPEAEFLSYINDECFNDLGYWVRLLK